MSARWVRARGTSVLGGLVLGLLVLSLVVLFGFVFGGHVGHMVLPGAVRPTSPDCGGTWANVRRSLVGLLAVC